MKAILLLSFLALSSAAAAAKPPAPAKSIFVYCAAGMRLPVERIAAEFQALSGVRVELTYDGSNKLLGQIKLTRKGDVYIAGDAEYVDMARSDTLIDASKTVCYFVPVILTRKGNPKKIASLADLTRPGIRLGQADGKAAAVGRIMPRLLLQNNVDTAAWQKNVVLSTATVNELGLAVKLGTLDAVVVWDAIAASYAKDADAVEIPVERNIIPVVEAAVLRFSMEKKTAAMFLDYLGSEAAKKILRAHHYRTEKPGP